MTRLRGARSLVLLAALAIAMPARGAGLDDLEAFLDAYRAAEPEERQVLARSFIARRQAHGGFPVVGADGGVVFLFFGEGGEGEVRLVGDFRTRSPTNVYWDARGEPMAPVVPGAPLFVGRLAAESDARLDYAFVVDGELVPDPLNPRRIFSGTGGGEVAELVMPGYRVDPALLPGPEVEAGTLHSIDEPWATAPIRVYLPPRYDPASSYPTLYTADGTAWIEQLRLPAILDRLIADGSVEPLVAVMIDPPWDRRVSYFHDPALLAYLERVVEHVDRRFATRRDPRHRVHAGTSAGGRVGLVAAIERPDLFGRVGALSPALHGPLSFWAPLVTGEAPLPPGLEVWMSGGTYEPVLLRDVETLAAALRRRDVPVITVLTHEGHSFGAWRNLAPAMLRHLFPPGAALAKATDPPRRMAITVDDLPVAPPGRHTTDQQVEITRRLLAVLAEHEVPAIGFVNESKLEVEGAVDPRRVALLERWLDAGHELGNHGYAHLDLHRVEPTAWQADVLRGERVTRPLVAARGGRLRWFRHPFLHTGRSVATQRSTARFLAEHGYRIAPVTVDNGEWIYADAYADAWNRGDRAAMERLGRDYVRYMLEVVAFYEGQSRAIVGELVPQTLLLHAYALNADWLDPLLDALEARGYRWVSLDEAVAHPAYDRPTHGYIGAGGITWLHRWAITAGVDRAVFRGEPEVPAWVREGDAGSTPPRPSMP